MTTWLFCVALLLFAVNAYGEGDVLVTPTPTSPSYTPLPTVATKRQFSVLNSSNSTCLLMNGSIEMAVGYNFTNHTAYVAPVAVLNTTTSSGKCNGSAASITLKGPSSPSNSTLFNITFDMTAITDKEQWNITNVMIWMDLDNTAVFKDNTKASPKPQSTLSAANPSPTVLPNTLDYTHSYLCNTPTIYRMMVLGGASDTYNLTLNLTSFQVQAFFKQEKGTNAPSFQDPEKCPADIKGSKIVPIAVGAALAGLVIIVIVAYIVGRLRSRKQNSYEALS